VNHFRSLAVLALAATPAAADIGSDYTELLGLTATSANMGEELVLAEAQARVKWMAGNWINLTALAGEGVEPPPPDMIERACERFPLTLTPISSLGLSSASGPPGEQATGRLQWQGGFDFLSLYDEASLRKRFFRDKADTIPAGPLLGMIVFNPDLMGQISFVPYGQDLMLVLAERRSPQIYGRCPA
jgi:hypothetical protein